VGVDLSLVGNRITITADYFSKRYSDMITDRLIPIYAGIVSDAYYENRIAQPVNSATVLNKGFEFAINYRKAQGVLTYDLGLNLTTYTNKVIKLDDAIIGALRETLHREFNTDFESRSVGEFYGWQTDGYFRRNRRWTMPTALGDPTVPFQNAGTVVAIPGSKIVTVIISLMTRTEPISGAPFHTSCTGSRLILATSNSTYPYSSREFREIKLQT